MTTTEWINFTITPLDGIPRTYTQEKFEREMGEGFVAAEIIDQNFPIIIWTNSSVYWVTDYGFSGLPRNPNFC